MRPADNPEHPQAPRKTPVESPSLSLGSRAFLLKTLLGLAITSVLVLVLTRYLDWQQLRRLASAARWPILLGMGPIYLTMNLMRSFRFSVLAPQTPFGLLLAISCIHNFLLRLLPMRTGELSYALLMRKTQASGFGNALLGLALLRLMDITVVVIVFAVALATWPGLYQGDRGGAAWIASALALAGLLTVLAFRPLCIFAAATIERLVALPPLRRIAKLARATAALSATIHGFAQLPYRALLLLFGQTLALWLCNYALIASLMQGFSIDVGFGRAVLGGTAATVSGFLPVGGIGSFGMLEAGWTLGFALVGLSRAQAVASGFAFSLLTFAWGGLFALVGWLSLGHLTPVASAPPPANPPRNGP